MERERDSLLENGDRKVEEKGCIRETGPMDGKRRYIRERDT